MASPFHDAEVRDQLFASLDLPDLGFEDVSTLGSGPFGSEDFDEFLEEYGYDPSWASHESTVVVIGRVGWTEADLRYVLEHRSGQSLFVYSQEMFLTYMLTGFDPLDDADLARAMAGDHPALAFLEDVGFDWPTTMVGGSGIAPVNGDWREVGYLKYLGYTVGRNALPEYQRRQILDKAFHAHSVGAFEDEYVREWGTARSATRLRKMAQSIASFCRNQKRSSRGSQLAIEQWESDLAWLKQTYYSQVAQFQWPNTFVR